MPVTKYLEGKNSHPNEVAEIAIACFGTNEQACFMEKFIPEGAKIPVPKAANFEKFLSNEVKHLWAVYDGAINNKIVGFILISDIFHPNALGVGMNVDHAKKGLMRQAWEEIEPHFSEVSVTLPLNGYTSCRNRAANAFMLGIGFALMREQLDFMREPSNHYSYEQ